MKKYFSLFFIPATLLFSCTLTAGDIAFLNIGKVVDSNPAIVALHKELDELMSSDQGVIKETAAKLQSKVDEAVVAAAKELGEGIPTYSNISTALPISSQKANEKESKADSIDISSLMNVTPLPPE